MWCEKAMVRPLGKIDNCQVGVFLWYARQVMLL